MTRQNAEMTRLCLAGLAVVAATLSSGVAHGLSDQAVTMEENEMVQNGKVVRLVKYGNVLYQRIEVAHLNGQAVGDTPLHNLLVCMEGKFDKFIPPNILRLAGSESPLAISPKERRVILSLMRGDNIWVAGQAQKMPRGGSSYVKVRAVVRLGNDMSLFKKRLEKYKSEGKWKRLIELGRWIESSGEQASGVRFEDANRYRVLKDRACRLALSIRERELKDNDADGFYDLAMMHLDLFGKAGKLSATDHLLKAASIDPAHGKATTKLHSFGYVNHQGEWMTSDELEAIRRRPKEVATTTGTETTDPKDPVETAPTRTVLVLAERLQRIDSYEARARLSGASLRTVAGAIALEGPGKEQDEAVGRRLVWVFANIGGVDGLEALGKALQSNHLSVRKDVADALAASGELQDLADIIMSDKDESVRKHAVGSMACVGTQESTGELMSLLGKVDAAVRTVVVAELKTMTGQAFEKNLEWNAWWLQNSEIFKGPNDYE